MKDEFKPLLLAVGALLTQLGAQTAAQAATPPDPAPAALSQTPAAQPQGVRATAPAAQAAGPMTGAVQERPLFLAQNQFQAQPQIQFQQVRPQINPGVLQGAHVNSGPTGHVNGGGHANFLRPADRLDQRINPGALQGSHVNSGPTGHANGGGHANFLRPADQFNQQIINPQFNPGALQGSHVNSGPTGHANGGGHANFNQQGNPGGFITNPIIRR